jgi:hypothetical protein
LEREEVPEMSGTRREYQPRDRLRIAQPGPDASPTGAFERRLEDRRRGANDTHDTTIRKHGGGPSTDRLYIDEADRP